MKARVKETGEIVEVYQSSYNAGEFYDTETGTETYDVSELDLLGTIIPIATEEIPDYWTRLEHQYAGMAMQGLISDSATLFELGNTKGMSVEDAIAEAACKIAHALVGKLKSESK